MSLQIECKGLIGNLVRYVLTAEEDYLEFNGVLNEVYYYDDIEKVIYQKKGLINRKNHLMLYIDNGYVIQRYEYEVSNDNGHLEEFCQFINQRAQNKRPEIFFNSEFDTNKKPEIQIELCKDYFGNPSQMLVFTEGLQIFNNRRIIYIKYSQMQKVYQDRNNTIMIHLRTSTGKPKIIEYFPLGFRKNYLPVMDYINRRIHDEEQRGNIETLNSTHTKVAVNPYDTGEYRTLKCYLLDERTTTYSRDRQEIKTKCKAILKEEYLEIQKESDFLNNKRGHRRIYYADIVGVDHDQGNFGNAIEIMIAGADRIILDSAGSYETQSFYELLSENVNKIKEQRYNSNNTMSQHSGGSDADELTKWYNLYQQGVISKDEFENKKRKFLD